MATLNQQSLRLHETPIAGVMVIERSQHGDERGLFERIFDSELLLAAGWLDGVAQVNHSFTREKGVVRGMHYQRPPYSEYKLVTCLSGAVWDVVVDLRKGTPSFLQHFALELTPESANALLIPPGCAHGFQTLSGNVDLLYCHSQPYMKQYDDGVNACDPRIAIEWPLPIVQRSERDVAFAWLDQLFEGI